MECELGCKLDSDGFPGGTACGHDCLIFIGVTGVDHVLANMLSNPVGSCC